MAKICEYLGVRQTATPAKTPNANGINEKNHFLVDRFMEKMMLADSSLKPQTALDWSITASNCLENVRGFSPAQLVFGQNPMYPSLLTSGPPGLEEIDMPSQLADHIHAMHSAREAYIQCESDRVLAEALKQRVYLDAGEVQKGMWVYFKTDRRWQGPVKIHSVDGTKLYAVRGGKLVTINRYDVVLAKPELGAHPEAAYTQLDDSPKENLGATNRPNHRVIDERIHENNQDDFCVVRRASGSIQEDNINADSNTTAIETINDDQETSNTVSP